MSYIEFAGATDYFILYTMSSAQDFDQMPELDKDTILSIMERKEADFLVLQRIATDDATLSLTGQLFKTLTSAPSINFAFRDKKDSWLTRIDHYGLYNPVKVQG